jgi:hypothetical protein
MKRIILLAILLCLVVTPCHAAKGFFLVKMQGGSPMLGELPYKGYVFVGSQIIDKVQYGAYKISGTPEQLAAIATSPNVLQVAPSKESLTETVTSKAISDTSVFLSAKAVPLKETSTKQDMVNTIFKSFHEKFDMGACDVVGEIEDEADYKPVVKDAEVVK